MDRIALYGRWRKRHSKWNDRQGTVGENLILVIGRKTSKVGLVLQAAYSNRTVNL